MTEILKKKIVNAISGEETWVDLTEAEIAEVEAARTEAAQLQAESEIKAAKKTALLERLGITEDEAKLLFS